MLLLQLVSLALLALASQAHSLELKKDVPVFVKTLRDMHRGPPLKEMRYFINDEFQTDGSPIFIFLGGEWEASLDMINGGHWYDMAKEHKAVLIYTEHRYYGASVPTKTMSLEDLKYLHVKQALADVANFIKTFKSENEQLSQSKVVLSGCSYSATMAVWFKRVYPDLVVGSWASSAPLLAKLDFFEYKEVVGKAFRELGGDKCYNRIQKGIAELEFMFQNKRAAEARAMLRICSNFDHENDLDLWSLFGSISNVFASLAQYQKTGEIEYYCDFIMSFNDDATAIANFVYWAWNYPTCVDVKYEETVAYYLDGITNFSAGLPWYYQTCNEYGWYQSSRSPNQPFGSNFPATLYIELCKDIFGAKFGNDQIGKNTAQTNEDFGGLEPNVENVYMTHGGLDPWNAVGHGVSDGATVISKMSHCPDLNSISSTDSAELLASKQRIAELLRQWLA